MGKPSLGLYADDKCCKGAKAVYDLLKALFMSPGYGPLVEKDLLEESNVCWPCIVFTFYSVKHRCRL